MSVKIYEGFRFNTSDFYEIHEYAMEFRSRAREYVQRYNVDLIASTATTEIDNQTMGRHSLKDDDKIRGRSPIILASNYLEKDRRTGGNGYHSVIFEVLAFPIKDEQVILGMTFTNNRELKKIWNEGEWYDGDFTSFFGYWDNTDPDEDCTEREWGERHRLWWKTGVCDKGANMCGFLIEGTNTIDCIPFGVSAAEVLEKVHLISFEKRVKHIAEMMASDEKPLKNDTGSTTDFMGYIRSPEYKNRVAHFSEEVATKLKKEITREDLLGYE